MDNLLHAFEKGISFTDKILNNAVPGLNQPLQDLSKGILGGLHKQTQQFIGKIGLNQQRYHYNNQDYVSLKQECLSRRTLFSDAEFPANNASLLVKDNSRRIEWKRPREISRNPRFFVDGASRFDLTQGEIGDCWLIATIANLTMNKDLFNQVIPPGQEFDESYAGIFYFRFWCFGEWREIVVDDKLPTCNGRLIYVRSDDRNEFWPSILEKAYAKLQGSYQKLDGGVTSDAMIHFTGGITETIELQDSHRNLFDIMNKGIEKGSLLTASIMGSNRKREQRLNSGLVRGHAYSITDVSWVNLANRPGRPLQLIRMRNPWGNEVEWKGPWSDRSREWSYVSSEEKKVLGVQFKKDGEFWMSFDDFRKHFEILEMTNVNLQSLTEHDSRGKLQHMWKVEKFTGAWVRGSTAGGCANYQRTFPHNPKFIITLTEADDGNNDGTCTMIVALLQRPRGSKILKAEACHAIGFSLYRISSKTNINNVSEKCFKNSDEIRGLENYTVCSQVSHRYNLPVGNYCLIPTTMEPGEEGDFILRIFTEKAPEIRNTFSGINYQTALNSYSSSSDSTIPYSSSKVDNSAYPSIPAVTIPTAPYPTASSCIEPYPSQKINYPPTQPNPQSNPQPPYPYSDFSSSGQMDNPPNHGMNAPRNYPLPPGAVAQAPYPLNPSMIAPTPFPPPSSTYTQPDYLSNPGLLPTPNSDPQTPYPNMIASLPYQPNQNMPTITPYLPHLGSGTQMVYPPNPGMNTSIRLPLIPGIPPLTSYPLIPGMTAPAPYPTDAGMTTPTPYPLLPDSGTQTQYTLNQGMATSTPYPPNPGPAAYPSHPYPPYQ